MEELLTVAVSCVRPVLKKRIDSFENEVTSGIIEVRFLRKSPGLGIVNQELGR